MALTALALALASGVNASAGTAAAERRPHVERAVLHEMNVVRARHGLTRLRTVGPLARPARAHSRWLLRAGVLRHEGPGGAPFWARLVAAGFPRSAAMGENLAMGGGCDAATARQVVLMWLDSPGHRANLLSPRFGLAGVGVASTPDCATTVVTADYGGRR